MTINTETTTAMKPARKMNDFSGNIQRMTGMKDGTEPNQPNMANDAIQGLERMVKLVTPQMKKDAQDEKLNCERTKSCDHQSVC